MAFYSGPPCDVGVLESRECAKTCTLSTGCWVLAAIILGSSLAFIDGIAVSVALTGTAEGPRHQRDADAVGGGGAYALFLAALLLVGGAMGNRIDLK
jgi:purine-cytosine permease-like protein